MNTQDFMNVLNRLEAQAADIVALRHELALTKGALEALRNKVEVMLLQPAPPRPPLPPAEPVRRR